jgi:hypothetical protein
VSVVSPIRSFSFEVRCAFVCTICKTSHRWAVAQDLRRPFCT